MKGTEDAARVGPVYVDAWSGKSSLSGPWWTLGGVWNPCLPTVLYKERERTSSDGVGLSDPTKCKQATTVGASATVM